jgi:hypothetical protein
MLMFPAKGKAFSESLVSDSATRIAMRQITQISQTNPPGRLVETYDYRLFFKVQFPPNVSINAFLNSVHQNTVNSKD